MTSMERIQRAGQGLEPGWDERDVERVWQGLKRKRRRRAVAAGAAAAVTAGVAVWAVFVAPNRHGAVEATGRSAPPPHHDEPLHFADGSKGAPWGGTEGSLAVVENTPARVVVALANGGARFDVVPRADRVFVVRAGAVTVSVLGTRFSVERVADRVGVTVTRGTVRVDWGAGARRLVAGEDGWFPPLVVSPGTEGSGGASGNDAPLERHDTRPARSRPSPASTPQPASAVVEPTAPAVPPAPEQSAADDAAGREATAGAKLLADADRARLAGRFEEGVALLERLVREHPRDERAPLAAFSLGRILLGELGRPSEAARAFARARELAPDGPLAEDARAREVEAWVRAGDPERARAVEAESRGRTRTPGEPRP